MNRPSRGLPSEPATLTSLPFPITGWGMVVPQMHLAVADAVEFVDEINARILGFLGKHG